MSNEQEELHVNPYLVDGVAAPNDAGKRAASHLYVMFENITMPLDVMSDVVKVELNKAQLELIMACLSLQCDY